MDQCSIHGRTPESTIVDAFTEVYREWRDYDAGAEVAVEESLHEIDEMRMSSVTMINTQPPDLDLALTTCTLSRVKKVALLSTSTNVFEALCDALVSPDCRIEEVLIRNLQYSVRDYRLRFNQAVRVTPRLRRFETNDESFVLALEGCKSLEEICAAGDRMWLPEEQLQRVLAGLPSLRRVTQFSNPLDDFKAIWPDCCATIDCYETRTVMRVLEVVV